MNDPCAPNYDSSTQTYHLFYQWNPSSCEWGNISWGHYTSRDGLRWKHNGDEPMLQPSCPYDKDGVFTGCMHPTGPHGEPGQLTIFYTSVTNLPIHWTLPYTRDSEGLAMATSSDGGQTWHKSSLNPILQGEPDDVTVVGFRDPYVTACPALDQVRGKKSLYGVLSGGILNKGPTTFLYAINPSDLTKWVYIGTLGDLESGFRPSPPWAGDLGINWECVNLMTLKDEKKEFQFLTLGSEGGLPWGVEEEGRDTSLVQTLWLAGTFSMSDTGPKLDYNFSGMLDHGCLYAPGTYEHPVTRQRIAWGWLKEDDISLERRTAKGYTGHLSLPRELFLYSKSNVIRGLVSPLEAIHSIHAEDDKHRARRNKAVWTLGIRPMANLKELRHHRQADLTSVEASSGKGHVAQSSSHWELEAVIKVSGVAGQVGFVVCQSDDAHLGVKIYYDIEHEMIKVDRSSSNREDDIKKEDVAGPFTLLVSDDKGEEVVEDLHLRIFRDGDVLEIFANDRFALSTMAYTNESCRGISWFAEGDTMKDTVFEQVDIWDLDGVLEDPRPKTKI